MENQNEIKQILTDKAFSRLVITSILAIFICIVCLCSTTFAWFNASQMSAGNEIHSVPDCKLTVLVQKDGIELVDIENGVELEAYQPYTVTLTLEGGSSSGYCMISAGEDHYVSDYILRHEEEYKTVSFTLTVETTQTIVFTPRWGIYAKDSDVVDGTLIIQ